MKIEEQIEVMQHFADGGEIEIKEFNEWITWISPTWNWYSNEYRIKPKEVEMITVYEVIEHSCNMLYRIKKGLYEEHEIKSDWIKTGREFQVHKGE